MKNEASVPHFGSYTYNSHYTRRYTRIITLSVSIWDPGLFWIHGIHCVSPLRRKAFPITCVLVTKRPLLPFPRHNPRVTGDLFESRYYRPRDCEAYLVRRRIFPPRRKRRGNNVGISRGILRFMTVEKEPRSSLYLVVLVTFLWMILTFVGWTFYHTRYRAFVILIICVWWKSLIGGMFVIRIRSVWQASRANG